MASSPARMARRRKRQPLGVTQRQAGAQVFGSEFYAEEVRRNLIDLFGEDKLYGGGLSVRTPLDPTLQRIARKTFVDGMVAYDHRHGWRGVVKNIDVTGDWGKALTAIKVWSDIEPWRLAVVLEVYQRQGGYRPASQADIYRGFREGGRAGRDSHSARCNGRVRSLKIGMGASPRSATDVLKPGDVIYVSPREPKDASRQH